MNIPKKKKYIYNVNDFTRGGSAKEKIHVHMLYIITERMSILNKVYYRIYKIYGRFKNTQGSKKADRPSITLD
ncbi:hypothetical protein V1478_000310 [Vespula squamosa]|uniref:Uncharacterized protein n=1 Tax=Vespula squamosa TaxID=30214 RepID=A0ABD2C546_VESSQ